MTFHLDPDERLAGRVKLCLLRRDPGFYKLSVWADDGVVGLSGQIKSYCVRQRAMSIAKHVAGIVHVMDDMHVSLPMGPAKRACVVVVVNRTVQSCEFSARVERQIHS